MVLAPADPVTLRVVPVISMATTAIMMLAPARRATVTVGMGMAVEKSIRVTITTTDRARLAGG
jgi:hypothetical protein